MEKWLSLPFFSAFELNYGEMVAKKDFIMKSTRLIHVYTVLTVDEGFTSRLNRFLKLPNSRIKTIF